MCDEVGERGGWEGESCFLVGKIVAHKQCTPLTNIPKKEKEICKVFLDHHSLILT